MTNGYQTPAGPTGTGAWHTPIPPAPPPTAPSYAGDPGPPAGLEYTPPPSLQTNPFGGGSLPENFPQQPVEADFIWYDQLDRPQFDSKGFYEATESWYTWAADFAQYEEKGFDGGEAPQDLSAQYLASHTQATIAAVGAEIEAGRLSLDQAEAAFNARMDAFAEAGKQRAEMWKWTVAPGQAGKPLHAGIREELGLEPWISQPTEINPFAEAQAIVESMPEMAPTPSTDPFQELLELTQGFLGR